jgi:hypothetical protein
VKYVGTFQGGTNTYNGPAVDIGTVPTPAWPAGWGPSDMPAWTAIEPFWAAYRNLRVNASATATSFNVTSSGVWYTEATGTLDVTGITAGVSIVIVAPRAAIKLPTDLSTSNLVGREFTPYNNAALPRQNVVIMSGFVPSDGKSCDGFAIEKSGESGTFKGIFWAPRAMVRWSGAKATLRGCVIAHAFQMNGSEHRIEQDPALCGGATGSANPLITLVK